jgi:D-glycero-alpha-D-manno-heptose-7-phosphate kinase
MIISRTPYRISFFGGGTDYPAWARRYGGAVLATTIDKYCYLTCRYLPPFFEHRTRVVYSRIETVQKAAEIAHPAVREILDFLKVERGVEIHHDGDLPARSGMGTSSSFTVGLLHALHALCGQMPGKQQLAEESIIIEQQRLKEAVGSQDQVLAAYGGFNHVIFHPGGEITVRPVTLARKRMAELNDHLMLFYTGILRTSSAISSGYANDVGPRKRQLELMKELVDEAIAVLASGQKIARFGELLGRAWKAKRSLSHAVSNPHVDEIYRQALSAGALGGKLTGAGGGGFMLLFVPPSEQQKVRKRLKQLLQLPFEFEFSGSQIIFFDPESDYSDAEKARAKQHLSPFREWDSLAPR